MKLLTFFTTRGLLNSSFSDFGNSSMFPMAREALLSIGILLQWFSCQEIATMFPK